MNAKAIPFQADMIRALLLETENPGSGKTQTRWIVKPQPIQPAPGSYFDAYNGGPQWNWWAEDHRQHLDQIIQCPYGKPGDLLWCRETWAASHAYDNLPPRLIFPGARVHYSVNEERGGLMWRRSKHQPRWASRMTLELTDVRVERLQDISEMDALAEGIKETIRESHWRDYETGGHTREPRRSFATLWDSINTKRGYGWASNPWVWALTFRPILANVDEVLSNPERFGIEDAA